MKRVLLTGATGFVGANLARRLLADGHEVHCLVRPGHASWRLEAIRRDVRLHEAALTDAAGLVALLGRVRPDWVFHLAVHGAYSTQTALDVMVQTNVVGTINLVQAALAHGVEALVNTGSSSEYGFKDHAPAETEWLEPNSDYAVTKASATLFCRYTGQSQGAPVRTLRLYSVYGPWEEPSRLLPTILRRARAGLPLEMAAPDAAHDFVYVDDVLDALTDVERLPGASGEVFNLGTGVQSTLRDVVAAVQAAVGDRSEVRWGALPPRR
ncbi:MAG TPA: NAD-dependent epimerase/dehydratase family protein, partial [Methylomirabilota bacterium]|nr:NAD-dependent epimerase/dehydratase family protein [Methylomirabilota bacterium]